jgi:peptidoglycan/LPS O-acetylase OafA/YrhL
MWGRSIEVMLGLWLMISPFLFGHFDKTGEMSPLTVSDLASGFAILLLGVLSFWRRTARAHLGNLAVALWLIGFGRFGFDHPAPPGAQNELLVGLVLVLIAIIPNRSEEPPPRWRDFYEQRARRGARGETA